MLPTTSAANNSYDLLLLKLLLLLELTAIILSADHFSVYNLTFCPYS